MKETATASVTASGATTMANDNWDAIVDMEGGPEVVRKKRRSDFGLGKTLMTITVLYEIHRRDCYDVSSSGIGVICAPNNDLFKLSI